MGVPGRLEGESVGRKVIDGACGGWCRDGSKSRIGRLGCLGPGWIDGEGCSVDWYTGVAVVEWYTGGAGVVGYTGGAGVVWYTEGASLVWYTAGTGLVGYPECCGGRVG